MSDNELPEIGADGDPMDDTDLSLADAIPMLETEAFDHLLEGVTVLYGYSNDDDTELTLAEIVEMIFKEAALRGYPIYEEWDSDETD